MTTQRRSSSLDRNDEEYIEHLPVRDEGVKFEIVFEIQDEEENGNESKDIILKFYVQH